VVSVSLKKTEQVSVYGLEVDEGSRGGSEKLR